MSLASLVEIIHTTTLDSWTERNKSAFAALFGSPDGRYPKPATKVVTVRAPEISPDSGVPFAAYIHSSNPSSGPYSGLSLAIFPVADGPSLIGMVVGTQGLSPDETILGRPGHTRKMQAICRWLNRHYGKGSFVSWAKQDPTRTDLPIPDNVRNAWPEYKSVFDRYGKELYALYCPTDDHAGTDAALTAFLDVLFEERGFQPIASCQNSYKSVQASWFEYLMPSVERSQISDLLETRRHVIIQGPPGTGKTRMAIQLLTGEYSGRGHSIQISGRPSIPNYSWRRTFTSSAP